MLNTAMAVEALIDYIATTPQNINYTIVREMLIAIINGENHPYFDYYQEKMESEKTEGQSTKPGGEPTPDDGTTK